jgi:hypothetical protein
MIRIYYPLPQAEKGATAVHLIGLHLMQLQVEVQPGHGEPDSETGRIEEFAPDHDLRATATQVQDREHFWSWYASADAEPFYDAEDHPVQQFVSALMGYLWLQRMGQVPPAPELEPEPEE